MQCSRPAPLWSAGMGRHMTKPIRTKPTPASTRPDSPATSPKARPPAAPPPPAPAPPRPSAPPPRQRRLAKTSPSTRPPRAKCTRATLLNPPAPTTGGWTTATEPGPIASTSTTESKPTTSGRRPCPATPPTPMRSIRFRLRTPQAERLRARIQDLWTRS